ncbi:AI-2E family transporter [Pontibacter diazotrophicus]|uniref:AI-2E family transporter n=1 Tax=Pontibacter diazotrophicus TaxID=1400979 RepID=A0A3D8LEK0_9BACT|nr:AI-2E family transporter [Pontibacter diazotrophicus]RDV15835.1 AI-2E family transporter [Pontibacter diazotrophicus]
MLDIYTYAKRVAIAALIVLLIVAGFYMLSQYGYFFLLVFAGILLAVLFCGMTDWIVRKVHMKRAIALAISVLFFFGLLFAAFWFVAPTVGEQFQQMRQTIPESLDRVQDWLSEQRWGEQLLSQIPEDPSSMLPEQEQILSQAGGAFSTTLGFLADLFIVIITALFFASDPALYTRGLAKLFPVRTRPRLMEVLTRCYHDLRMWLIGMLAAMAIIGISTAIGYSIIGLPMAFALALIAFLFAFVPNIGPWIAGIPAVLIGLLEGPDMALTVLLVYGGIQIVESWIITPIIFQKTVALPPALLLFFQVLLGLVQGGLGLLMAAPILAVLLVFIQELYVKDVLEAKPEDASASDVPESARATAKR